MGVVPMTRKCKLLDVIIIIIIIIIIYLLRDDTIKRARITVQRAGQQGVTNNTHLQMF